ncbi:MAG: SDR family oxidoreductase [Polyangiaceae bacterium]|nr:SDR family oxidoreductase [Polyangiaceae bacterium]
MSLAVITGASRGIGRATALALAARGVDLALVGRSLHTLTQVCEAAAAQRVQAFPVVCDLADSGAIIATATTIRERAGDPEILVNNAAIAESCTVANLTPATLDRHLAVNLRAPALLSNAFLPAMLRRGHGRIIHVASISATLGTPRRAAYNASKWGLVGFMRSLAAELTDSGVITLAVLPGSVDTEMLRGSDFPPRMTPAEVAQTLLYYALDAPLAHNGAVVEMFGV